MGRPQAKEPCLFTAKEAINKMKKKTFMGWWKYLQIIHMMKELTYKILKNSHNSIAEKQITMFKNGQRTVIDIIPKDIWEANRYVERCSASLIIKEMQVKIELKINICSNGHHQKKMLVWMWQKRILVHSWWDCKLV